MARNKVKGVRLTRGELAAMKRAASDANMGLADWMRSLLLDGLDVYERRNAERQLSLPAVSGGPLPPERRGQ